MKSAKQHLLAFTAGFLATLVFHRGLIALLHLVGFLPIQPFNMMPTIPFGVPSVMSLSFFGGLWGILVWQLVRKDSTSRQIYKSIIYGAIGPTAVAFLVVFPLRGNSVPLTFIPIGLLLNGVWGFGVWVFMKLATMKKVKSYET